MYMNLFLMKMKLVPKKLLLSYKLYLHFEQMKREMQDKKRKKEPVNENETFISHTTFHLVNAVKFIKENLDLNDAISFSEAIKKATAYVQEIVEIEKIKAIEYNHNRFFKDSSTNEKIRNHI